MNFFISSAWAGRSSHSGSACRKGRAPREVSGPSKPDTPHRLRELIEILVQVAPWTGSLPQPMPASRPTTCHPSTAGPQGTCCARSAARQWCPTFPEQPRGLRMMGTRGLGKEGPTVWRCAAVTQLAATLDWSARPLEVAIMGISAGRLCRPGPVCRRRLLQARRTRLPAQHAHESILTILVLGRNLAIPSFDQAVRSVLNRILACR